MTHRPYLLVLAAVVGEISANQLANLGVGGSVLNGRLKFFADLSVFGRFGTIIPDDGNGNLADGIIRDRAAVDGSNQLSRIWIFLIAARQSEIDEGSEPNRVANVNQRSRAGVHAILGSQIGP